MKKNFFKENIQPTVVLVAICLVITFALAYVNSITAPIIEQNKIAAAGNARAVVLPGGSNFKDITSEVTLVQDVIEVYEEGNGKGIVVTAACKGFGGLVNTMVGIDSNGQVAGVQVMSHSETQGLGTNAMTTEYLSQFVGLDAVKNTTGTVDGTEIACYTGASYSSGAIINAVSAALVQYQVYGGASYEAPVEKTVDELKAEAVELLAPGATKVEGATLAENVYEVYMNAEGTYAVYTKTAGYHAQINPDETINAVVGVSKDGAITGIVVVEHNETAGVGTNALVDTYYNQFVGAKKLTLKSDVQEGVTNIVTVSGCTVTSEGVYYGFKAALKQFELM